MIFFQGSLHTAAEVKKWLPSIKRDIDFCLKVCICIQYFFDYKTECFPSKTIKKNLDPSYKIDLDLWDCLGRVKPEG